MRCCCRKYWVVMCSSSVCPPVPTALGAELLAICRHWRFRRKQEGEQKTKQTEHSNKTKQNKKPASPRLPWERPPSQRRVPCDCWRPPRHEGRRHGNGNQILCCYRQLQHHLQHLQRQTTREEEQCSSCLVDSCYCCCCCCPQYHHQASGAASPDDHSHGCLLLWALGWRGGRHPCRPPWHFSGKKMKTKKACVLVCLE